MAPPRVIADSDDEDGVETPLSPPRKEVETPDVEPLSPGALDQHNLISDITDLSFFASVYDEQQARALEHSRLIENIVRQSQKASESSGDVSLPAKGKGRKANASSATNVTSPVVLNKLGNQPSLFSDDATSITTPRKSAPSEWDVPSSAETMPAPRSAKSSRGKNEKSYGKRKRSNSKAIGSSAAAEMFMGDGAAHGETVQDLAVHDETLPANNGAELSPQASTKRAKVSLHDSVLHDTPTTANFYIAQSNLTTMQKLEYQRVNVSQYGYPTLPGTLPNPKSSGMSTIAYSTPSRYTSSGPPLPWERSSAVNIEPGDSPIVINIASSPDVIAADHDYAERTATGSPHTHAHPVHHEIESPRSPNDDFMTKSPPSKKRKRKSKSIQDEDELVQEESWNPETTDNPGDEHQPQRHDEQTSNSQSLHECDDDVELIPNPHEVPTEEIERRELPREDIHKHDQLVSEMPSTAGPILIDAVEPNPPETQSIPKPKKRGRKKKQPPTDQVVQDEPLVEIQSTAQELIPTAKPPEVQAEPGKPKKKRGRPRKSDPAKPETPAAPEPESNPLPEAREDADELSSLQTEAIEKPKPKPKKKQAQRQEQTEIANGLTEGSTGDRDASPLREISSNPKTPSQRSTSAEGASTGSIAEPPADQKLPSKTQDKASTTPKPTPSASQPKVPYRVGLSKRTRITSLLKSIKR
ncbi:hypothetical protein M434DRAFT_37582 [Hypoxylon sp. CO27-5]|nr:hypothetical protein M434DRAFT_37582 [Hypoxylon sp. CO27-5]